MRATEILPTEEEIQRALGPRVHLERDSRAGAPPSVGEVLRTAALDSGYRNFRGRMAEDSDAPIVVSAMALVFDSPDKAERTFGQVAEAAHLSTRLGESRVAVETVTSSGGLVSYWSFVHLGRAIVVLTLDTVDPQLISMADFRSVVSVAAERLESQSER